MTTVRLLTMLAAAVLGSSLLVAEVGADINVGSDGSDGTLIVTSNTTIDLSLAVPAAWNTPSPTPGAGVYDSQQWAVVFKYDSVYVAAAATVTFSNHATTAPVVWLVARGVRVDGTVNLEGSGGLIDGRLAAPGPGGFRGAKGTTALSGGGGPGAGPGGGGFGTTGGGGGYGTSGNAGAAGGFGGATYGNPQVLPLIGGSGGGGTSFANGGGGGGGALLIAASRRVQIAGLITANGGFTTNGGGGSGGAIRVIADQLGGAGTLLATGGEVVNYSNPFGDGGLGRIRLEANSTTFTGGSTPVYTLHLPVGSVATVWPPVGSPRVAIGTVAGVAVPTDPNGNLLGGDIQISSATSVPVTISAANVPSNATMTLRAVLVSGGSAVTVSASFVSGDQTASTWTATLPAIANNAYTLLQARVTLP